VGFLIIALRFTAYVTWVLIPETQVITPALFCYAPLLKIQNSMLTPKELEVLNLVSRGLSTNKISEKLHISDNTVEGHRKVLLRKFHAKNSVDLVRKAMKANWIK
jgi:DNA-binding NarL/FixJ family response regulator